MNNMFIKSITIEKVRHLENILIPISDDQMKHLVITGRNGSGKTSLLDSVSRYMNSVTTSNDLTEAEKYLKQDLHNLEYAKKNNQSEGEIREIEKRIDRYKERIYESKKGIDIEMSFPMDSIKGYYEDGDMVVAYYRANRIFQAIPSTVVEKVKLKQNYLIDETPRQELVKYLLDMKMTQALAGNAGKEEKVLIIQKWFDSFENLLCKIFNDKELKLVFNEESFLFHIEEPGKEPFDFNTLSSGYAAVLDIVVDLMLRMENHNKKTFLYDLPGVVLIDEIETHLHLEMQKNVMELLTTVFPNIQFIVTTHSPFIVNSTKNATIFDIETRKLVKNGLTDIPYSGIVEGYFKADELSNELKDKFERYKELIKGEYLSDDDFEEIAGLELYLDEIPDYLALDIATEYKRMKLEFKNREDV